jgi:glycosyltransferase involved in cell wall biosynthesis
MNLKSQTYPHNLLTVIIDDDGTERFIDENDLNEIREIIAPIKIQYIYGKPRRSIGKKRDDLIKACNTKIFMFIDDDDVYFPNAISYSYKTLKEKKLGCVGSDKMIFCMTDKDFSIHAIDCGNTKKLIHEATLMATKKWYRASCGFSNSSKGEGANLFYGMEHKVGITDVSKIMCCVQHGENTVDKLQFAKDDNKIDIELSDDMKELLQTILKK